MENMDENWEDIIQDLSGLDQLPNKNDIEICKKNINEIKNNIDKNIEPSVKTKLVVSIVNNLMQEAIKLKNEETRFKVLSAINKLSISATNSIKTREKEKRQKFKSFFSNKNQNKFIKILTKSLYNITEFSIDNNINFDNKRVRLLDFFDKAPAFLIINKKDIKFSNYNMTNNNNKGLDKNLYYKKQNII